MQEDRLNASGMCLNILQNSRNDSYKDSSFWQGRIHLPCQRSFVY